MRSSARSRPLHALLAAVLISACGLLGAWVALAAEPRSTSLVSTGPAGGDGPFEAEFAGATSDGSQVFFWTEEPLVGGDANPVRDLYRRGGGETTQITAGPGGSGAPVGEFGAVTADGGRVFFTTTASLVEADGDESADVYERSGETTTLLSTGPAAKNTTEEDAGFAGASSDGGRVFFETAEQLVKADEDESVDVYERAGETTTLLSVGPEGEAGQGPYDAGFAAASADGDRVFFETREALVGADEDGTTSDVYERFGGETAFVSVGGNATLGATLVAASTDGTRVLFLTTDKLVAADTDNAADV